MTDQFRMATLQVAGTEVKLHPNEIKKISGTNLSVRANLFNPSFDVDANGAVLTRDSEGRNPALQIDFLERRKVKASLWILKNNPDVAYQVEGEHVVPTPPPPFRLMEVSPILFSGIQVGYDPGAPVFWTGAALLLAGLCCHFYLHQRRLRILITPKRFRSRSTGAKSEIFIGGWNSRSPGEFEKEFSEWAGELHQAILGGA
jgi:cytochrome c biogenesis protein ResB